MRLLLFTVCLSVLSFTAFAQAKKRIQVLTGTDMFDDDKDEIEFKLVNNNILVPVDLGRGLTVYFILDSGVKTTIITDPIIIPLLDLPLEREINVKGYGSEEPIRAWVSTKFNYKLNETYKYESQDVIILQNPINLTQYLGEPVYGIIGYDFLKEHQITINYLQKKLLIKAPSNQRRIERLQRKKNVRVYDLEFIGSKPFIHAKVKNENRVDSLKLLVDTGFSGALSLYPNKKTDAFLVDPIIPNYQGYGMNGLITSKFKKLDNIYFNQKTFMTNVSTHFIDSISLINVTHIDQSDGSIGNDILRRFTVSFDYPNQKLYLRPLKSKIKEPFQFNNAGIRVLYNNTSKEGPKYLIQSIRKDSAADKSGLLESDRILSIDGKKVDRMNLTSIYKILNNQSIPLRNVVVERNKKILEFTFDIDVNLEWN